MKSESVAAKTWRTRKRKAPNIPELRKYDEWKKWCELAERIH